MRTLFLASTIALLGFASTAEAHFGLVTPPQVVAQSDVNGKGSPPCGPDTGMAATPTAAQGGHPLTIKVTESVGHLGFYRVALALHSRSELPVDNVVYDNSKPTPKILPPTNMPTGSSDHADFENPAVFPVLADNFFPHEQAAPNGMTYMGTVMLPNVSCDRCILQVIEFMHPHGFNGPAGVTGPTGGGGYFYHHCAELKITADPALPLFGTGADGGTTDAAGTGGAGGAGGMMTGAGGSGAGGSTAGTAGTGGTTGTGGVGGTGTAGTTGTGTGGTTGTAGTGATGAAGTGTTAGTAGSTGGSTGAAGSRSSGGGGGGCSLAGRGTGQFAILAGLIGIGLLVGRRRKRPN